MRYNVGMDLQVFLAIYSLTGRWQLLDQFMIFSARWLPYVMIAAAVIWFLDGPRRNRFVLVAFGAALLARFVIVSTIYAVYDVERPFEMLSAVVPLVASSGPAFPSGHAAFYTALAVGLFLHRRRPAIPFLTAAALVVFARVYTGVHWPSDVAGGALIGAGTAWLITWYVKKKRPA